jgi:hypothetical protein
LSFLFCFYYFLLLLLFVYFCFVSVWFFFKYKTSIWFTTDRVRNVWRYQRINLNSYKPITNTAWVRAQLCKLQKGCTRLAAASDKVYQLLAHGRWFSPGTQAITVYMGIVSWKLCRYPHYTITVWYISNETCLAICPRTNISKEKSNKNVLRIIGLTKP